MENKIRIEFSTQGIEENGLIFDIIGERSCEAGKTYSPMENVSMSVRQGMRFKEALSAGQQFVITIAISMVTSVTASLIANYIWDKIKNRPEVIQSINDEPIRLKSKEELENILSKD